MYSLTTLTVWASSKQKQTTISIPGVWVAAALIDSNCIFKKLGNEPINDMISIVSGKTAIEIVNTLIKNKYISSLQHAADMGIELCKAELALKYNLNYVQDKDLKIKLKNS